MKLHTWWRYDLILDPILKPGYMRIIEGQCPYDRVPLDRRESDDGARFGWCDECERGWSITGNMASIYWRT